MDGAAGGGRRPEARSVSRLLWAGLALWSAVALASLGWNGAAQRRQTRDIALAEARSAFERDLVYRLWGMEGSGPLAPGADAPSDPGLPHLPPPVPAPGTSSAPRLTDLVCQMYRLESGAAGARSRLVSLAPRCPDNAPDPWEAEGLGALAGGAPEVSAVGEGDVLRLLRPLVTQERCLGCHRAEGYRVGDVQGAISVTVPLEPLRAAAAGPFAALAGAHALLWGLGAAGLVLAARRLRERARERDQAWAELLEERDFTAAVLDTAGALVVVLDREGRVARFNRACEDATGFPGAEVQGRPVWEKLIPPEDVEAVRRVFADLVAGDFPTRHENSWLTAAGGRRLISWSNTALAGPDGAVQWVIATGIDVTDHRRADEALRQSEERYRALVENVDLGITLIAADHTVLMANAAQGRFFGREPQSFLGRKCYEEFEKRDERCTHCPGTQALATGRPAEAETEGIRDDGTRVAVRIRAFPILGADGRPEAFIEVVEDVTEARRAREERRRLEAQMQQAQKLESLGVLAGGIAHDFNNLLMGVLGNADMALAKAPPESPLRVYLRRIETAARRAADLTNQMLAYSGKGRFVVEPIDLSRLVEEMGHLLETVVSKRAILRYDLRRGLPPVEADATQVRQVVMNLIVNASDAIGERSGVVTVHTGAVEADRAYLRGAFLAEDLAEGTYVCLEVSDTGCGMDAETRGRIFDPFFTTKAAGRGLGLAAVLGIVRGHRGTLKVYSEPGRGTTFKVLLPTSPCAGPAGPGLDPEGGSEGGPPGWQGSGTVLVVDDDETVRAVAKMMLEDAGFRVLTAADGLEGVALYRERADEVVAVLLDMTMPHLGGEETFRELRRIRPDVRVLLSSGYNEQDAVARFSGKGLAGFLQKPYRASALLAKLREVLEGAAPGT